MDLNVFSERILRPSVLKAIKCGQVDSALTDPDVLEIYASDDEIMMAIFERLKIIYPPTQSK